MPHTSEVLKKYTAIYRSPDDINNLKIRVKIQVENGESAVFAWQQKVYGKFEREFYKDKQNCITDLEKRYHENVIKLIQQDDNVLFTYTNEDGFDFDEKNCLVNSDKISTELSKQIKKINRNNATEDERKETVEGFNYEKSLMQALINPYGHRNFQIMHIMADLGEYVGNTWLKSEHVLCTIKYDPCQKYFLIHPDFADLQSYSIETTTDDDFSKLNFQYFLQDASQKMPIDLLLKENEILNKITMHQSKLRLHRVGCDFETPAKNKLSVHLFCEILTAKNFEYDNVYVEYFIDLPENWYCQDRSSLRGTTHSSRSIPTTDNSSYFGFPFEVSLEYNIQDLGKFITPKPPHIYFEVISKDSWDRFRTEGLAYVILPIIRPGCYRYDLNCLRICPKGPLGDLRRFFIGDYSNYNDVTWISVPKYHDKNILNKYGVNTVGTGILSVRINVIRQSREFCKGETASAHGTKREKFILEKLNASNLAKSIEQVLEAFKAAKKRMIEVRKNFQQ